MIRRPVIVGAFAASILAACAPMHYQQVAQQIDTIRPELGAHDIVVKSAGSTVTLEGFVRSEEKRLLVEAQALSVRGVDTVENRLEVRPREEARAAMKVDPESLVPSDDEVLRKIRSLAAAEQNYDITGLEISVNNGVVTLKGDSENFRNVDRLLSNVVSFEGVSTVRNRITVAGRPYSELTFKK